MQIYICNCINLVAIMNFSNSSSSGGENLLLQREFNLHRIHMWNSNSPSSFQKPFPHAIVERKKERPPQQTYSCASFLIGPNWRLCLAELPPCPGQASCMGRRQALNPLICAASQLRSAPAIALLSFPA